MSFFVFKIVIIANPCGMAEEKTGSDFKVEIWASKTFL
jgi:hypothetical protein